MNNIILKIIFIIIGLYLVIMTSFPHNNLIFSLINGFLIGFICVVAYKQLEN